MNNSQIRQVILRSSDLSRKQNDWHFSSSNMGGRRFRYYRLHHRLNHDGEHESSRGQDLVGA